MRIESSQVSLSCEHLCLRSEERIVESAAPDPSAAAPAAANFRSLFRGLAAAAPPAAPAAADPRVEDLRATIRDMLQRLWEMLCGRGDCRRAEPKLAAATLPESAATTEVPPLRRVTERRTERETTRVDARGEVRTADGRRIAFDTRLVLDRSLVRSTTTFEAEPAVRLRDPLVLEFAGPAAALAGKKFRFDLDADGQAETLPGLGAGSGFLVFDRNGNGRADDGRELFGAATGDGFADLAALDADANGWIDEADPDFVRLRVWGGDPGAGLATLAAAGVGALHLGRVDSPFELKDEAGELLGQIRQSGIWLGEDGRVGALRQVDLAVQEGENGGRTA